MSIEVNREAGGLRNEYKTSSRVWFSQLAAAGRLQDEQSGNEHGGQQQLQRGRRVRSCRVAPADYPTQLSFVA